MWGRRRYQDIFGIFLNPQEEIQMGEFDRQQNYNLRTMFKATLRIDFYYCYYYFLQLLRLHVQDQGAGIIGFWFTECQLFTVSSHGRERRQKENSPRTPTRAQIPFVRALCS